MTSVSESTGSLPRYSLPAESFIHPSANNQTPPPLLKMIGDFLDGNSLCRFAVVCQNWRKGLAQNANYLLMHSIGVTVRLRDAAFEVLMQLPIEEFKKYCNLALHPTNPYSLAQRRQIRIHIATYATDLVINRFRQRFLRTPPPKKTLPQQQEAMQARNRAILLAGNAQLALGQNPDHFVQRYLDGPMPIPNIPKCERYTAIAKDLASKCVLITTLSIATIYYAYVLRGVLGSVFKVNFLNGESSLQV